MNNIKQLHWPLIIGMGALALVRPFLIITGVMDWIGWPSRPYLITMLVSVSWLAIVVLAKVRKPLLTLIFTGFVYGVFTLLLTIIFSPIFSGDASGPLANPIILPFAVAGILVTNTFWGFIVGVIARGIQSAMRPDTQKESRS